MEWSWLYQSGPEVPIAWRLIRFVLLLYGILTLFAHFHAMKILYPRPTASYRDTADILKLQTEDGHRISAIFLKHQKPAPVILYSHGNGEDLGILKPLFDEMHRRGYQVMAYDYSGYGTSEGRPSERTTYRDLDAAYAYLVEKQGIAPQQIFLYGRSLGGGVAVDLASRAPVGGLILESSFTSAYRVMTHIPLFPFDKYIVYNKIGKVNCPVFIIHGRGDRIIPLHHGEQLFAKAREPKLHLWVDEAGHNDMYYAFGSAYWQQLGSFTGKTGAKPEP